MSPMLLTDCRDPESLIHDADWYMEEKLDGDRMVLRKSGNVVEAWSRNGKRAVPEIVLAVALLSDDDWTLDGELMPGGNFVVHTVLNHWNRRQNHPFKEVRLARTEEEKRSLFDALKEEGAEGVVFKKRDAKYLEGTRSENWQRWKWYESDDFTALAVDIAKCSFEVWRNGKCFGRVACHLKRLPKNGDVVRLRYDSITKNGKLLRAKLT